MAPAAFLLALPIAAAAVEPTASPVPALTAPTPASTPSIVSQSSTSRTFDHALLDALLRAHVTRGMVDYDAFARSAPFARYLAALASADVASLPKNERLAFWINAYNAYTIQLINKHGERKSIRNINKTGGFIKAYGPWKEKLAIVGGRAYGLDEIEQDIIRPEFKEPRIHFALVCAAIGCPPLRSEAYTGVALEMQLDDQARQFLLQAPTKNRVDVAKRTVYLSPIFVEFRDYIMDFGGSNAAVGKYIARYFPPGAERDLLQRGDFKVVVTEYDWALNHRAGARK